MGVHALDAFLSLALGQQNDLIDWLKRWRDKFRKDAHAESPAYGRHEDLLLARAAAIEALLRDLERA